MQYGNIIRAKQNLATGNMELDMRPSDKLGIELRDEIYKSVEHTQKFIVTNLPSVLIVTQKQFASLNEYTERMFETTDRMMLTPHNVMEVVIDRDFDTVEAIEEVLDMVDAEVELAKSEESEQLKSLLDDSTLK